MKKYNVIFRFEAGNKYSYFVKAGTPEEAIDLCWHRFIDMMNLHSLLYEISARQV